MKLITKTHNVNTVAARWRKQYPDTRGEEYAQLAALDHATATADDVARIIGNNSWAGPRHCAECDALVVRTVELGTSEYGNSYMQFCESCLVHALRLIKAP